MFWPAGRRDGSLLRFESPKLSRLSLMSVAELREARGYQALSEKHTSSPPLPSLLTAKRPMATSLSRLTNSASHVHHIMRRGKQQQDIAGPPGPPRPPFSASASPSTARLSRCVFKIYHHLLKEKGGIQESSTAAAQGFAPNCPPTLSQAGQRSLCQTDKTKDKH